MVAPHSEVKDSLVVCRTSQGVEFRAALLRLTRFVVVFECFDSELVLQTSEVFEDCRVLLQDRLVYSGRGVLKNMMQVGVGTICEVTLAEGSWRNMPFIPELTAHSELMGHFRNFLVEWQRNYRLKPEFKVIVADMQSFLADLRLSLDQVAVTLARASEPAKLQRDATEDLCRAAIPCLDSLFAKFEAIAKDLDGDESPAHRHFARRHLHPLVLCAPFVNRTFNKPLGYAGDYEMVNMIVRNKPEGASLFAKVVNTWFLHQRPAEAHRQRIDYLARVLRDEALRASRLRRSLRVFNLACGPAQEVQKMLRESPLCDRIEMTLLDFNEETLNYARSIVESLRIRHARCMPVEYVKKSVQHIIKESSRLGAACGHKGYDLVYCAGLFDYLSDPVCRRLTNIMYDWLTPGGLLVVTNVDPSNPLRNGMEHLLDWHLIYRTADQLRYLSPSNAAQEDCYVQTDATGVNVLLEVRKPDHD